MNMFRKLRCKLFGHVWYPVIRGNAFRRCMRCRLVQQIQMPEALRRESGASYVDDGTAADDGWYRGPWPSATTPLTKPAPAAGMLVDCTFALSAPFTGAGGLFGGAGANGAWPAPAERSEAPSAPADGVSGNAGPALGEMACVGSNDATVNDDSSTSSSDSACSASDNSSSGTSDSSSSSDSACSASDNGS